MLQGMIFSNLNEMGMRRCEIIEKSYDKIKQYVASRFDFSNQTLERFSFGYKLCVHAVRSITVVGMKLNKQ